MDKRGRRTVLSQGLDHSPSPPPSRLSCGESDCIDKSHSAGEQCYQSLTQPSVLPRKRKLSNEKNNEGESSERYKNDVRHILVDTSTALVKPAGNSTFRLRAAVQNLDSSTKTNNSSGFMKDLSRNDFSLDRSRLSLPSFAAANHSKVMKSGQTVSRFSSRCAKKEMCTNNAENTLNIADELSFGLMPAARSSVLHDSFSIHRSSDRGASRRDIEKKQLSRDSVGTSLNAALTKKPRPHVSSFTFPRVQGDSGDTLSHAIRQEPNLAEERAEMEGDSEICKTVLSVIWHKGLLGACIYNTDTMKLQLLQDIPEDVNFLTTRQLFVQTQPDVIITGAKQDGRFMQTLKDLADGDEEDGHQRRLQSLSNEDLGYEVCRKRLVMTCENTLAQGKADTDAFIKSTVNLNFINMVRASGGLLRHLENSSFNLAMNFDKDLSVLSVELYVMTSQVWVDANTFSGLRILHLADHPSTSLGNRYTREGFSLFGLMDRCKTSSGKLKLKELFLRPSRDIDLLNERLDCLEYLQPSQTSDVTQIVKVHLSKLRNMSRIVCKMRNAELNSTDWLALHRVLKSLIVITNVCTQHKQDLPILAKFADYRESIHSASQILFDILDVEQTKLSKTFTIKTNYDAEMDLLVQKHRDLPELLAEKLTNHVKEVKRLVRSAVHIHYSSQLGCMLMIDITPRMERTGDYTVSGLKLEFLTESNAYYSSEFTREISELHGDVNTDITDRALALMYQLQNTLLPDMDSMLSVLDLCAQLDCLIGLSSYCYDHNFVRPELNNHDILVIKGGRHALLDAQVDHFICNDTISGPGETHPRIAVVTGPNGCGKSIYLKQILLIAYLAHIGCFVPAESANIFLADALLSHFPTSDSINSEVSTFTADLSRMAAIVANATSRSLVALDEFGKGTCPVDGASLLLSFLHRWISSDGGNCPHVLASSHFHIICKLKLLKNSPLVSFKTLETHAENGKLVHLHELVDGAAESSQAVATLAQLLEIPNDCLARGAQATEQFAMAKPETRFQRNSKHNKWKRKVVETMLGLDSNDEDNMLRFLDSIAIEE